jgi:SAM-dependent MidA family methyltransferase
MSDRLNSELATIIEQRIVATPDRRISFAEYMNLALYHPQFGYYSRGRGLGASGDFATSVHLCADFGELLAEQLFEMWQILGCPKPFTLLEMGAGQGILAGDIFRFLKQNYPSFFEAIDYCIIEKSTALKQQQQQHLQPLPIRWCEWDDIETHSITGCCFSNELVDAFPVHQIAIESGQLREVYVTVTEEGFAEEIGDPSTPELAAYFELIGIELTQYPDGYRSEVNLAALAWIDTVAQRLQRGYLLTIDYGYLADRYYSLGRRSGTLQCYAQHHHHNDPYINVGSQDITAHVDFTALQRQGDRCGLTAVGFTQQALFLMALGLGDRISTLGQGGQQTATAGDITRIFQRRQVLQDLINPMGLGNFGVLVQSKGLIEGGRSLRGLTVPGGRLP